MEFEGIKMKTFKDHEEFANFLKSLAGEGAEPKPDNSLRTEDVERIDSEDALTMATASACGASNDILTYQDLAPSDFAEGQFSTVVDYMDILIDAKQKQSEVWMGIHKALRSVEDRNRFQEGLERGVEEDRLRTENHALKARLLEAEEIIAEFKPLQAPSAEEEIAKQFGAEIDAERSRLDAEAVLAQHSEPTRPSNAESFPIRAKSDLPLVDNREYDGR